MKIVKDGSSSIIYSDDLQVFDCLQPAIYNVMFHPQRGFWLQEEENQIIIEETKIYGSHNKRINKIFNTYDKIDRNLGVLLSGDAGLGKSLMIKLICKRALELNIPIIMITKSYLGLTKYLGTITQPCLFVFDEFEKNFDEDNRSRDDCDVDTQQDYLTFFDGVFHNKHLFIVSVNQEHKVNRYFFNRPGRFHYHFRLTFPNSQEITEYLEDKLDKKYYKYIENVIRYSMLTPLSYDTLRAIAFELNNGYDISETFNDLNISCGKNDRQSGFTFDITILYSTGEQYTGTLDSKVLARTLTYNNSEQHVHFSFCDKNDDYINVQFDFTKLQINNNANELLFPIGAVKFMTSGINIYEDEVENFKLPKRYKSITASARITKTQKTEFDMFQQAFKF